MNFQVYSTSNMTPTNMTLMPKTATVLSPPMSQESEKLVKMKNRKMKKQARKDVKNVKQVIVTEGVTDEYNIDNILEELGEVGNIFYRNIFFKIDLIRVNNYQARRKCGGLGGTWRLQTLICRTACEQAQI